MSEPCCRMSMREGSDGLRLRVAGRATYRVCPVVRRLFGAGSSPRREFCLDLRGCDFMDSSFVGTLLWMQRCAQAGAGPQLVLVSPSTTCALLFEQMGLTPLLTTRAEPDTSDEGWAPLATTLADPHSCRGSVVQAHEELARLPGPTGDHFRPIANRLAAEANCE